MTEWYEGLSGLAIASRLDHVEIVEQLLKARALVESFEHDITHSPLSYAANEGNEEIVELLADAGADLNFGGKRGQTPVMAAMLGKNEFIVETLLDRGADPNCRYQYEGSGEPAIVLAVRAGRDRLAEMLLKAGAEPNVVSNEQNSPLTMAIWSGSIQLTRLLLAHGAAINARDSEGKTALYRACDLARTALVPVLLDGGADPSIASNSSATPLLTTAFKSLVPISGYLIEAGANVNASDAHGRTPLMSTSSLPILENLIAAGANVHAVDKNERTALMEACQTGRVDHTQALVKAGSKVDQADAKGCTALMLVCRGMTPIESAVKIVGVLLEAGADVNKKDAAGRSCLALAAGNGCERLVATLLEAGSDVDATDSTGKTALMAACGRSNDPIASLPVRSSAPVRTVKALLRGGAKVDVADGTGTTALMLLCCGGIPEKFTLQVLPLLVKAKADVNGQNNLGETPLALACSNGCEKLARQLVDAGAKVNSRDGQGRTPLMAAACNSWERLVTLLLRFGAAADAVDIDGSTAMLLARANNATAETITALQQTGLPPVASSEVGSNFDLDVTSDGTACDSNYKSKRPRAFSLTTAASFAGFDPAAQIDDTSAPGSMVMSMNNSLRTNHPFSSLSSPLRSNAPLELPTVRVSKFASPDTNMQLPPRARSASLASSNRRQRSPSSECPAAVKPVEKSDGVAEEEEAEAKEGAREASKSTEVSAERERSALTTGDGSVTAADSEAVKFDNTMVSDGRSTVMTRASFDETQGDHPECSAYHNECREEVAKAVRGMLDAALQPDTPPTQPEVPPLALQPYDVDQLQQQQQNGQNQQVNVTINVINVFINNGDGTAVPMMVDANSPMLALPAPGGGSQGLSPTSQRRSQQVVSVNVDEGVDENGFPSARAPGVRVAPSKSGRSLTILSDSDDGSYDDEQRSTRRDARTPQSVRSQNPSQMNSPHGTRASEEMLGDGLRSPRVTVSASGNNLKISAFDEAEPANDDDNQAAEDGRPMLTIRSPPDVSLNTRTHSVHTVSIVSPRDRGASDTPREPPQIVMPTSARKRANSTTTYVRNMGDSLRSPKVCVTPSGTLNISSPSDAEPASDAGGEAALGSTASGTQNQVFTINNSGQYPMNTTTNVQTVRIVSPRDREGLDDSSRGPPLPAAARKRARANTTTTYHVRNMGDSLRTPKVCVTPSGTLNISPFDDAAAESKGLDSTAVLESTGTSRQAPLSARGGLYAPIVSLSKSGNSLNIDAGDGASCPTVVPLHNDAEDEDDDEDEDEDEDEGKAEGDPRYRSAPKIQVEEEEPAGSPVFMKQVDDDISVTSSKPDESPRQPTADSSEETPPEGAVLGLPSALDFQLSRSEFVATDKVRPQPIHHDPEPTPDLSTPVDDHPSVSGVTETEDTKSRVSCAPAISGLELHVSKSEAGPHPEAPPPSFEQSSPVAGSQLQATTPLDVHLSKSEIDLAATDPACPAPPARGVEGNGADGRPPAVQATSAASFASPPTEAVDEETSDNESSAGSFIGDTPPPCQMYLKCFDASTDFQLSNSEVGLAAAAKLVAESAASLMNVSDASVPVDAPAASPADARASDAEQAP
ncbi:hypothetical protein DIPPA_11659 [Diplonema papillatum]|nr:hypothetical protein DIPPA_11659 [Diplonema papillatum]